MKAISNLKENRRSCQNQKKQEELQRIDKKISDKTTELNILKEGYLKTRL